MLALLDRLHAEYSDSTVYLSVYENNTRAIRFMNRLASALTANMTRKANM